MVNYYTLPAGRAGKLSAGHAGSFPLGTQASFPLGTQASFPLGTQASRRSKFPKRKKRQKVCICFLCVSLFCVYVFENNELREKVDPF